MKRRAPIRVQRSCACTIGRVGVTVHVEAARPFFPGSPMAPLFAASLFGAPVNKFWTQNLLTSAGLTPRCAPRALCIGLLHDPRAALNLCIAFRHDPRAALNLCIAFRHDPRALR